MSVHNRTEYFANLRKSYHIASIKPAAEVHILLSDATLCDLEFSRLLETKRAVEANLSQVDQLLGGLERKLDEYKFGLPTLTLQSETAHYLQCKTAIDSLFVRLKGQLVSLPPTTRKDTPAGQFQEHLAAHLAGKLRSQFERFQLLQRLFSSVLTSRQPVEVSLPLSAVQLEDPLLPLSNTSTPSHQVAVLDDSTRFMVQDRDREIDQVVTDVSYVHDILNQMQVLTVEQGGLLDRIDVNLDATRTHLHKAIARLERTAETFSVHQKRLILLFMTLMIFVLTIAIAFRQ